jgi:glycosyltransferase involved in cell wall biosynthesis
MGKKISVIIPTYNRAATLKDCLAALAAQTCHAELFEIIVVDDGSSDGTAEAVAAFIRVGVPETKYIRQRNLGPAAARNAGIRKAAGDIVLFIGDDIMAAPDLLARHIAWHEAHPAPGDALLGYVTWDPDLPVTPFMRWLEDGGPQFSFNTLRDGGEADPRGFFYTCNVSLKRAFLLEKGLFDEDFPYAAFEDSELGYRLIPAGLRLIFDRSASAWHRHYTSLGAACARMVKVGESKRLLNIKTGRPPFEPPPGPVRRRLKIFKLAVYYALALFFEKRARADAVFKYVMEYYFERGVERSRAAAAKGIE